jgi:RHS repeat-associated protein
MKMLLRTVWILVLCLGLAPTYASDLDSADYTVYAGDFNGDGYTDLLYVAKTADKPSGIALADPVTHIPVFGFQSWSSDFLGVLWLTSAYNFIIGDFNGDGCDDILMQPLTPGNSYLLTANCNGAIGAVGGVGLGARGTINSIAQTLPQNYNGYNLSADQVKLQAGDFNGDGSKDLLVQAVAPGGQGAIILSKALRGATTPAFPLPPTAVSIFPIADGTGGYGWSATKANLFVGDFNGDGRADALVQSKPNWVLIDYDVAIPVPYFPTPAVAVFTAGTTGALATTATQAWPITGLGATWSPLLSNVVVGDFNGDGYADILLQPKAAGRPAYLLLNTKTGAVFPTASTPSATVAGWSADTVTLIAGNFGTHLTGQSGTTLRSTLFVQSASPSGIDALSGDITGATVAPTSAAQTSALLPVKSPGRTAAQFSITPTGAASYNVPIWTPPGVHGVEPHLSLRYTSGGPDGVMGPGWSISGISMIVRCGKTYAASGTPAAVTLSTSDDLCLDGNRMRLTSGTQGAAESTYQTEIADFSQITANNQAGNGPRSFTVRAKDGNTYEYGGTADSRISAMVGSAPSATPYAWALDRVTDRNGNIMTLAYVAGSTSVLLSDVNYTALRGSPTSFPYNVHFTYANRTGGSVNSKNVAGGTVTQGKQLSSVTVKYNGTAARQYVLNYTQSLTTRRPLLNSIQECGGSDGSDCLRPTTFSYQSGANGWSTSAISLGINAQYGFLPVDVNGDGIPDAVYATQSNGVNHWYMRLGTLSGYSSTAIDTGIVSAPAKSIIPGRFAGNARTQLLAVPSVNTGTCVANTWCSFDLNGSSSAFTATNTGIPYNYKSVAVDYDGDGLPDLVSSGSVTTVRRNTSNGTRVSFASPTTIFSGGGVVNTSTLADFNGDGRADLIVTVTQGSYPVSITLTHVLLSNGFGAQATDITTVGGAVGGTPGDWNGDGCTDLVARDAIYISDCLGNFSVLSAPVPKASNGDFVPTLLLDWDGDGQSDRLYANPTTNTWWVQRSTGTGIASAVDTNIPAVATQGVFPVDINSDGQTDLAFVDAAAGYNLSYFPHRGFDAPPDLMVSATDGFGVTFSPTYQPISQTNYLRYSTASYPDIDFEGPMYVVTSYAASDGLGGSYSNNFQYYGAKLNLQGRGFEGFSRVRQQDSRQVDSTVSTSNPITDTYYRQDFPYIGSVAEADVLGPDATTLLSKTVNTYAMLATVGYPLSSPGVGKNTSSCSPACFPYVLQTTQTRYEYTRGASNTPIASVVTGYVYDNYGTLTSTTSTTTDTDGRSPRNGDIWTTTIANTIVNDATNWCLGRPSTTTTTTASVLAGQPAAGQPAATTRTVAHAIDPVYCRATQETVEPTDARLKVTTNISFDACGNTNSVQVIGLDENGALMTPRLTQTTYDSLCLYPYQVTDAANQTTTSTYRYATGVRLTTQDPNGLIVTWDYDNFGRRTSEIRPDGTKTLWSFSDCVAATCWGTSDLRFMTSEAVYGSTGTLLRTHTVYSDALDRVRYDEANRALGAWTTAFTTYDQLGRKVNAYLPYSSSLNGYHHYTYDMGSRVTSDTLYDTSGGSARVIQIGYDGDTTSIKDPLLNVTTKVTDAMGKIRQVTDPTQGGTVSGTTYYEYNTLGNLRWLKDATGVVSQYFYNVRGFKIQSIDADTGNWKFTPNSLNELKSQTDALGHKTSMTYDLLGRMISRLEPESPVATTWTFGTPYTNTAGRLVSLAKPDGYAESYVYDAVGRPKTVTYTEDGTAYAFDYAYNTLGTVDTITYPVSTGGVRVGVKYNYDSWGFLNSTADVATGNKYWSLVANNDASLPTTELLGNLVTVNSTYKPWTNELLTRQEGSGGQASNLQSLAYVWDANGNLTSRQDKIQNLLEAFSYDGLNRLTGSTLNGSNNPTLALTYDAAGNIKTKSDVGTYVYGDAAHPHAVTAAGPAGSAMILVYDANGNATSRGGGAIVWTSYNLPSSITNGTSSTQFNYNASHQRWKQQASYAGTIETTHYVGGLLEVVQTGTGPTEYRHQIPAGSASAIYTRRTDGTTSTYYATSDHLGSADLVLNNSGNVLAKESFTPFGARRGGNWQNLPSTSDYATFASTTRRGFTGHEMLDSVGLVHMNGRVYDPYLGRFLSADSVIQNLAATQTINPYSYAGNDPTRYIDPSGHSFLGDVLGVLAAVVTAIFLPELLPAYFTAISAATVGSIATGLVAGFVGGFVGAYVSTGSLSAALTAGLISGVVGGLTAGAAWAVSSGAWSVADGLIARVAIGCASALASSGNCGKGALAAGFAIAAQPLIIKVPSFGQWGTAVEAVQAGIIGGEAAKIAGGKFEDGFTTSAVQYLANPPPSNGAVQSVGSQIIRDIKAIAVDIYAATVGQIGALYEFLRVDVPETLRQASENGLFSGVKFFLKGALYNLLLPHNGYYGGSGWGVNRNPWGDPLNQSDVAAFVHDNACARPVGCGGASAQWAADSFATPAPGVLPNGVFSMAYSLLGLVPFTIAGEAFHY